MRCLVVLVVMAGGEVASRRSVGGDAKVETRAEAWFAGHFETAAQFFEARPHIGHTVHSVGAGMSRETAAIVTNGKTDFAGFELDSDPDFGGAGVTHDIGEGFLKSQEQLVSMAGIHGMVGGAVGSLEVPDDIGQVQKTIGVETEITHQRRQRIVAGIGAEDSLTPTKVRPWIAIILDSAVRKLPV